MHELSIAMTIVDMAQEEAERRNARVEAVHLKLGVLAGVVKQALLSSYELACEGTALEGSRLIIQELPVIVYCEHCQSQRALDTIQHFACPTCARPGSEVIQGRELQVAALEIDT